MQISGAVMELSSFRSETISVAKGWVVIITSGWYWAMVGYSRLLNAPLSLGTRPANRLSWFVCL